MRRLKRYHKPTVNSIGVKTIANGNFIIHQSVRSVTSLQDNQQQTQSNKRSSSNYSNDRNQTHGIAPSRKKKKSDQNVLKTLYHGNNEIVLSLLKTHFVRIFSSNDNASSSLFTLHPSNIHNTVPLSHHLLELLRTQNIDIHILNNHKLVDQNILKEYHNVISLTSNYDSFDALNKTNNVELNQPFYVDFVLKRNSSDSDASNTLYLGIFELEKLLFQLPPLSMRDKLITILNEHPEGVDIGSFCKEYQHLFRENFIHQSEINKSIQTLDNLDKDTAHINIGDIALNTDSVSIFQDFFDDFSEIVVSKYVQNTQDFVLFANINQKISLNVSNWIQNIIVDNPNCWFNALFNAPNMLFVEYAIKSPSTLVLHGRLSYLESVIQYFQWLDQVEQFTVSAQSSSNVINHSEDDVWTIFISKDNIASTDNTANDVLFDTNNYFNNNDRFKLSKALLLYGIQQSYFIDVHNLNHHSADHLELHNLFNESIFVYHPYDAPAPITLATFLDTQMHSQANEEAHDDYKNWKLPLVVENILKRKKANVNKHNYPNNVQNIAQNITTSNVSRAQTAAALPKKETLHPSRRPKHIEAKVVQDRATETTSTLITKSTSFATVPALATKKPAVSKQETEISLPDAIESNLENLSKPSHHKLNSSIARKLLRLLMNCELENYASAMRLNSKISIGNKSKIAISEYDLLHLWKSYYRSPLNINHYKMMQQLIYIYYPYFEIHLVSDGTKQSRYISIRDDPNVLSHDTSSSDKIPIYNADTFQAVVRDLLQHKNHSDGLYLSQIISKLSQSNQYVFTPNFFDKNWDERHTLWLLHAKNSKLSVIPSSPRYDPIITAIESHHSIQDFITREVQGHDRRDGNGVSLAAILSLVRAVAPNFFNVEFQSVSNTSTGKPKNVYFDDIIHFILDIGTVDLMSVTGTIRQVSDLNDITAYASPDISELHESIATIVDNLSRENQDSSMSVIDKISVELMSKYPALNTAKYGFANDIESLIESTPNFTVYKPYPLSPSYILPTPYVTLCNAISDALKQFDAHKSIVEVQLRSAVIAILNPNLSESHKNLDIEDVDDKLDIDQAESIHAVNIDKPIDAVQGLYEIYEKYLTDIPKYFSHLLQCEWNEHNQLWSFKHRTHDANNLLFKIRSIFEEFDRNYTLLNTDKMKKNQKKHFKQVKIPAHSFQQKWDLKYGQHAFKENQVENMLFSHPFIYVIQSHSKPDNDAYIWQMQDHQLSSVYNALLLHLSELYVNNHNQCHLNEFQDLYAKIYGHPCVQSDIYSYFTQLGLKVNPETLMIDLQPCYYYHVPLSMDSLSKISYVNLSAFSHETGCKLLQKEDIDPYDSSVLELNIASTAHRNLNGFYIKLVPLPTSAATTYRVNDIINSWMNRLCSKYLGSDTAPILMNSGDISALEHLLAISNQDPKDEHLHKIRRIMSLFDGNKTEKQSIKWNDKLIEILPRSTAQSVSFENIKDLVPFNNETQLLHEILFDPLCLSMINVERNKATNTYAYSLNEEVDEMDIKSNVSTELILQNIVSMNPQGIHLSAIKKYFPLDRLQLTADHSLIDWLQHRFSAYIAFDEHGFITWNNIEPFNQMMRSLNLAEMQNQSCKSRENTLNNLLFVDTTSVVSLMDSQTMTVPAYISSLCQYIHNVSINLHTLPSSVPYNLTQNYDWLYHSLQISYRPSSSSNMLQHTQKTVPLKYITQQILDHYQQQMSEMTSTIVDQQSDVNPEKLSMHSISDHMPLCVFASKLYDKLLSHNASLSTYLPLFRNLDHFLKLYGFQITKPSFAPSHDFQLIHIKPSQEVLHSVSIPENVTTLYHKLLSNDGIQSVTDDDIILNSDDIRYILNFCHRDIDIEYKQNKKHFSFRAPLLFPENHAERTSIVSKVYKRQSQVDDIAEILNTMKRNEKYMRLSQFISRFAENYNYLIPIEPLIQTLDTESNRYTKPILTELADGDYFIAMDDDCSLGARFESIFMDNNVDTLTMPELKSLWFKKFSQQYLYPDGSLFTLINQFSNKFVLSVDETSDILRDAEDSMNYTLHLLNPDSKFSYRVKSVLNSLQTHNTQPIDVNDIMKEWNAVYAERWHDNDTIHLYLLPFVSISHPDQYQTKPMVAFDTNFIDIFSDIQGKWNLNMIERLDTLVKQILLSSASKTVQLSQFQSKFLSFSGYIFPKSTNLIESLRQLPSITVDTNKEEQSTFCDPVIRLREHVNLHESALSESIMLSEFDQVFQQKELMSMNLSNFNKYYSQIFGKKFFQDISDRDRSMKSVFYQLIKKTYNIWQIDQNSNGLTTDWLIGVQRNVHNPLHKTTFYILNNTILSEINKSPNKKLYESELPQILPNATQFKGKLRDPNQIYPFDQYSNTAYFLMYNSPQQIAVQYDASSNQPFFTLRPKKFGSKSLPMKSMVSSYICLEEIVQSIIGDLDADSMRLCDFQTHLFEKLPETTDWPWIFNKFPSSISSFINIDYSKLDRRIYFENKDHLHQKVNHYIKTMKPNDSKLRENIMQQFYTQRQRKLSLQTLSESLDIKWPSLLNKIINIYSLDFKVTTPKIGDIPQSDSITLTHSDQIMIHHPAFAMQNTADPYRSSRQQTKTIEQGLVLLALKYKDQKIPMHDIQQILYSLTGNNMLYTSNLMQSMQMLGLGRIKLTDNSEHSRTFSIPTIAIKGWQNELHQTIMNAFVSSLAIQNTTTAPYLPYITEGALRSYLDLQFVKQATSANVFRALTDSLWADLYADIHTDKADHLELRFSLRPLAKHWNAEESKQLDALLNNAHEKVMQLSQLQNTFYTKHNMFIQGEQSKRALSEFLSSKAKYCVLPLKNGDYLFTFTSYSKNLLRYFVRDIVKKYDTKGFTLEQIHSEVQNSCDLDRLKQLKRIKTSDSIIPFPINNYVLMDICSDLIFPYYATQPSAQNPIPTIIYRDRKKPNVASNVRDVIDIYQQERNASFISFSDLKTSLKEAYPTYYPEIEQNDRQLFQTIASFPWLRFHLSKTLIEPQKLLADTNETDAEHVWIATKHTKTKETLATVHDWNIEITLNANDIQHMRNDVSCEIFAALQRNTAENDSMESDTKSLNEEDPMYRNAKSSNDLTMKAATFQNKFSSLTGLFYNPAYQSVTHYLLQISYTTKQFPYTLPEMDADHKIKQLFASRFFGVRLSEINELLHKNNYLEFSWCLPRIIKSDPNITLVEVPYGPPDYFVVHSELNTMTENDIIMRLQEIFKKQRMFKSNSTPFNASNTESSTLLTESQIRTEWKSMFGKDVPFAYSMDLYHAFSHHFNDYITVHSFGNNKMFSMNDVQLLYNMTPSTSVLSQDMMQTNQEIAKFVQKDQLSQQRKKIFLLDAIQKISNDINYKTAEELLYSLYETQVASSIADGAPQLSTDAIMIHNKADVINVTFSQLFRNVLQPLKLEIGRSQSMDWLSYLMFRFNGFLSLLPQNVPDLQFSLQNMRILKEKCDWINASRVNPMVNFNPYEREHILASLTQNEEEDMNLADLYQQIGEYFWSNHGNSLHHHIVRTLSPDVDIQHMDKTLISSSKESMQFPKHSKVDKKWSTKHDEFTVRLRSSAPQLRFCDIFEPVSEMLRRLDLSQDKICGMNEIQNQFYMLFGTYLPSTNLKATLIRYGAISSKPSSLTEFANVKMSQSKVQKTHNDIIVDAIIDYMRSKLIESMHSAHVNREQWFEFDEIMAYLHTIQINLGEKATLFEDIIHYLIDKRSLDFVLELNEPRDENLKKNQNHQNPHRTNWKIKLRPFISETNGNISIKEVHDLINSNENNGAIKLSQLQSSLYAKYHKIIEVSPRTQFSLYHRITDMLQEHKDTECVLHITPCGADSIVYTEKMSMYREAVRYALSYYCGGLRTHQLRNIIDSLLVPKAEYQQFSTEKLNPSKDISAIYQILSNCCFSFCQIARDPQTGVYLITPFNIESILAYKIRNVVDNLSLIRQTLDAHSHPDGVLFADVKQELIKANLWNTKTHEFLLSAPFLSIKRDAVSNSIRISCLNQSEIESQKNVILHHIVCENVLKCNTYNLQDMYCNVTGNMLDLGLSHTDNKGNDMMISDAHQKILKENSLKELLIKCNLRLHHDPQSRENLILPKTTIVRLKKPWLTREKQLRIRHSLNQLAKQYRIRYVDFVEEFVLEVPTFIATSTFFIHGSGLSSVLTPKDLDLIIEHITNETVSPAAENKEKIELQEKYNLRYYSNYNTKHRNMMTRSDLDMTINGENFAIMMGLDCAHLLRLTFFRGTIRAFLRRLTVNNIRLSQIQELYETYMNGSRWWSTNIADELRRLNCVLYADGYGDFMIDISHLRPMYDNKSVRGDLSFKIM